MRPWYNRPLQTAIEAAMPIRKPVFSPPFNIVRASHVELAVRDLARSRALLCRLPGLSGQRRGAGRALSAGVEERNHHSIVLREGKAAAGPRARLQGGERGRSRPRRRLVRAPQPADRVSRGAVPGPHAAHRRLDRHAARLLFQDGSGPSACCSAMRPIRARASSASTTSTASRPTCRRATISTPSSASA